MRIALGAAGSGGVWADGPLVHNEQAVRLMALHGVGVADAPEAGVDKVLVRAHGVAPDRRREWETMGLTPVDATCPHVARNQRLAANAAARGVPVLLAGDRDHAEVRAVLGSAGPTARVVSTPEEAERVEVEGAPLLLAQTTFNVELFDEIASVVWRRFPESRVVDTICRATHDRQAEAARIARMADVLVVVGGKNSANTRRLADTGRAQGKPVFLVETADELCDDDFLSFGTAAVTSGASTPGWITQEVVNRLRGMGRPTPVSQARRLLNVLVESRITAALSAAGLAMAAQVHQLEKLAPALVVAGACYVFFAHTLARRVPDDPEARRLAPVDAFYRSRRSRFLVAAWLAAALALLLAFGSGSAMGALFCAAVGVTAAYAWAVRRVFSRFKGSGLMGEAYSSRAVLMAVGWTAVTAGPAWWLSGQVLSGAVATLFIFLVVFGGGLLRDMHDVASDSLLGMNTLPARLGQERAGKATLWVLGLAALLCVADAGSAWAAGTEPRGWVLFTASLVCVPLLGAYIWRRMACRRLLDAVLLQAGVDAMGCLAGVLALAAVPS